MESPAEERDADLLETGVPLLVDKSGRPRAAYRNYHRWARLSRLAMGAFVFTSAIALLWLVPWIPRGLDAKDYTAQVGFTVYLLLAVAILGMVSLFVQERTRRNRESLMVWSTVYDETTGLHNRTYLFDRLALECERARRGGSIFTVIVVQIRGGTARTRTDKKTDSLPSGALRAIAEVIDSMTHPTDIVSVLGNSELVIIASQIDRQTRHPLQQRLSDAITLKIPELLSSDAVFDVRTGSATYGVDGSEPSALVQAARTSTALSVRSRLKTA